MQLIVRQISGLGNQLFQYAAGRYFSARYGAQLMLALDQTGEDSHGFPRPFLLSNFLIRAGVRKYSSIDRHRVQPGRYLKPIMGLLNRLDGIQTYAQPFEQRYTFLPDIDLDENVHSLYIIGYWQAYRFAASMGEQLQADLTLCEPPRGRNLEVLNRIRATRNSVSLHMRRGDYTLAVEGNIALPIEYYNRAIALFDAILSSPTYFVFSDDIGFAKRNLTFRHEALFIDHNDSSTAHEDLRLMSACENHIIANSTFSWWGAWLNPKSDKLVYAPKYWLLKRNTFFEDLYPPGWILDENLDGSGS